MSVYKKTYILTIFKHPACIHRGLKKHNRYCVEKMFGVSVAVDSLERYVARVNNDVCAFNMLGILLERQRHFRTAKRFFTKALQLEIETHLKDQVLQNLARVLYKLGEFEASVKCYQKINSPDFYGQVRTRATPGFFIQNIHSKSKIEGM